MICNERTTRILPGLSQALAWLRESLPPSERTTVLIPIPLEAQPRRHRPTRAGGAQRHPSRYRQA
jgi:hypothetical protein